MHRYEGAELAGQPIAATRYFVDRNDGPSEPRRGYGFDDAGGSYGVARVRGPHYGKGPQGFRRSDERIEELVCEALYDDGDVDATNISVSAHDGEVTLAGTVGDRRMKRLAEDCALRVGGVTDVLNQIKVRPQRA
ncbi:MAG TPA: BON domain-containing protein [Kofleriaceae bacterium]